MTAEKPSILVVGDLGEASASLEEFGTVVALPTNRSPSSDEIRDAALVVVVEGVATDDLVLRIREEGAAATLLYTAADAIPTRLRAFDDVAHEGDVGRKAALLLSFHSSWDRASELGLEPGDIGVVLEESGLAEDLVGSKGLTPPGRVSLRHLVDIEAVNRQQMSICQLMGTANGTFLFSADPEGLPDAEGRPSPPMGPLSPYCAYLSAQREHCISSEYGAAREALLLRKPVETRCAGGIRMYSVPVCLSFKGLTWPLYAATVAVGGIPVAGEIGQIAERYGVNPDILRQMGEESRFWVLNPDKTDDIKATISNLAETISGEVSHKYGTAYQLFQRVLTEHEILRSERLLAASARDLAETNRRLKLKNDEVFELTHAITHDLKKPLVSLKAGVGILRLGHLGPLNEKQSEAIEASYEATQYMQELVMDLLEAARLDAGRKVLEIDEVAMGPLVERIRKRFRYQLEDAGVQLEIVDLPEFIPCDEKAIEKVLMNLVGNAVSYIGDGEKRITIRGFTGEGEAGLRVEDTGMGIPEESLPNVFDKFRRGDNVAGIRGTGLGLAIVNGIILAHGGRVTLDSREGEGTTFSFALPLAPAMACVESGGFQANRDDAGGR